MKTILGIDPGASGGIAWWHELDVINPVNARPMPPTRGDLIILMKAILKESANLETRPVAYIEKISGFIPDGGASQMFEFGRSVERVGCILETLGCRIIEVTPQAWQKSLTLGNKGLTPTPRAPKGMKGEDKKRWLEKNEAAIAAAKAFNARAKTEWKNKLKSEAQRLFPRLEKVTLKTSDCLLILEYGMRTEGGGQMIRPGAGNPNPEFPPQDTEPLPFG